MGKFLIDNNPTYDEGKYGFGFDVEQLHSATEILEFIVFHARTDLKQWCRFYIFR